MRRTASSMVLAALLLLAGVSVSYGDDLNLPPDKVEAGAAGSMMHRYVMRQADEAVRRWQADYEQRKTPEAIAAYQKRLREKCLDAIGGLPERTPLEPLVTGTIHREGYRIEKVLFQSQPKHHVTALLFLPDSARFKPPHPGVIVPCGHAMNAKGHEEYQSMGALLALHGMAALVFDPIDQGERGQRLGQDGWPKLWGTRAHTMVGAACILLGRNTARFEIWDGMRAVDYLQSRPEVDPKRIGCTGNSGGGTQTSYMMALDDRVQAAAPSCYITSLPKLLATIGPQDAEQHLFGQMAFGADHADLVTMRAPTPILLCAATKDFFDIGGTWDSFRYAKRLYTRMGFAERVDLLENDAGHNYNKLQREGVARWMARWLLGKEQPITEPPLRLLRDKELQCTAGGQVMMIPGARSVYDLNEDYESQLASRRAAAWKSGDPTSLLEKVRQLAGVRKLAALPRPQVEPLGTVTRTGFRIEKLLIKTEEGISLPALLWLPEKPKPGRIVLYVHAQGKAADAAADGPIERLVQAGDSVLAADLRGIGQTRPSGKGRYPALASETQDFYIAYLLGRSYVGMRAEDVLVCARYAAERAAGGRPGAVRLIAVGNVGIPSLHAAALEPELFQSVKLSRTLVSWPNVIHSRLHQDQLASTVHGALAHYDLTNLAATLGEKLVIEEPLDAMGRTISATK